MILGHDFGPQKTLKTENGHFLTAPNQVVLQGIKKFFEEAHLIQKSIEFQLPHYEIPQLSSHYITLNLLQFNSSENEMSKLDLLLSLLGGTIWLFGIFEILTLETFERSLK